MIRMWDCEVIDLLYSGLLDIGFSVPADEHQRRVGVPGFELRKLDHMRPGIIKLRVIAAYGSFMP